MLLHIFDSVNALLHCTFSFKCRANVVSRRKKSMNRGMLIYVRYDRFMEILLELFSAWYTLVYNRGAKGGTSIRKKFQQIAKVTNFRHKDGLYSFGKFWVSSYLASCHPSHLVIVEIFLYFILLCAQPYFRLQYVIFQYIWKIIMFPKAIFPRQSFDISKRFV